MSIDPWVANAKHLVLDNKAPEFLKVKPVCGSDRHSKLSFGKLLVFKKFDVILEVVCPVCLLIY